MTIIDLASFVQVEQYLVVCDSNKGLPSEILFRHEDDIEKKLTIQRESRLFLINVRSYLEAVSYN